MFKQILYENTNAIHCFHYALLPLAVLAGKFKNAKVIYDISEFNIDHALNWFPSYLRSMGKLGKWFENVLIGKISGVTCVPDRENLIYRTCLRRCTNTQVILNVPELEKHIDKDLYTQLKRKYNGYKTVVYAGAIKINKGILEVVKAVGIVKDKFPNIKLVLIGSSFNDDTESIIMYIKEQGLDDYVEIIPFQPYERLETYYHIAHYGLNLPTYVGSYKNNLTTGNSRKSLDFTKASLPIIVPDLGEMGLLVKQENCGVVVPACDATNIERAILYLLDNPSKAKEMGQNGYRVFLKRYNWNIEKKKLLKVYNAL